MSWYWVLGINPEPWEASRTHVPKKGNIRTFKSGKLVAYQKALQEEIQRIWDPTPLDGPFELELLFERDTTGGQPADVTNLQKAAEDALQGVLYANDRDCVYIASRIVDQWPGCDPRIGIRVYPAHDEWKAEVRAALRDPMPGRTKPEPKRNRSDLNVEEIF